MKPYYDDGQVTLYHGDCRDVLPTLDRVDHVITDPPYSEASHAMHDAGKRWAEDQDGLARATLRFTAIDGPFLSAVRAPARRSWPRRSRDAARLGSSWKRSGAK